MIHNEHFWKQFLFIDRLTHKSLETAIHNMNNRFNIKTIANQCTNQLLSYWTTTQMVWKAGTSCVKPALNITEPTNIKTPESFYNY